MSHCNICNVLGIYLLNNVNIIPIFLNCPDINIAYSHTLFCNGAVIKNSYLHVLLKFQEDVT